MSVSLQRPAATLADALQKQAEPSPIGPPGPAAVVGCPCNASSFCLGRDCRTACKLWARHHAALLAPPVPHPLRRGGAGGVRALRVGRLPDGLPTQGCHLSVRLLPNLRGLTAVLQRPLCSHRFAARRSLPSGGCTLPICWMLCPLLSRCCAGAAPTPPAPPRPAALPCPAARSTAARWTRFEL